MDPSSYLRPVGPLPPAVYWRRRAAVAAGVLVALVILVKLASALLGGGGGGGDASPTKSPGASSSSVHPSASASATGSPSPGASASGTPASTTCAPTALVVSATADKSSYGAGVEPRFGMTVRNTSATPCKVDLGPVARSFTVVSGSDRIWSSSDCAKGESTMVTLAAGEGVSYTAVWDRHRSAKACAQGGAAASEARSGTYRVTASVGEVKSEVVVFRLSA